jgi:hypothetical protein
MFRDSSIAIIVPPNVSLSLANRGPDAANRITKTATHATVINNARFITMPSFPSGHLAGFAARLADAASSAVLLPYTGINAVRARSPASTPSVHGKVSLRNGHLGESEGSHLGNLFDSHGGRPAQQRCTTGGQAHGPLLHRRLEVLTWPA